MSNAVWGWQEFSLLLIGCFFIWILIRGLRNPKNQQGFTKKGLSKSFYTMGLLALVLMAFISFCIFVLRL